MAHLGARAFDEIGGEVVQTTAFVNTGHINDYKGTYIRLVDIVGENEKRDLFLSGEKRFAPKQENFSKIPGCVSAYWVSDKIIAHFSKKNTLFTTHSGITTGDNDYFLKLWFEIDKNHIYKSKQNDNVYPVWYFHHKGGSYRKWYGNAELVLHYDAKSLLEMNNRPGFRHDGKEYFFMECGTWNKTSTGKISVRYSDGGYTFNTAGCCLFSESIDKLYYAISLLNSNVMVVYLSFLCPTFSFTVGDVAKVPIIFKSEYNDSISRLVENNILTSKQEWDSYETSWDFEQHPLI